jgi:transporter family-2 protein
MVIGIILGFASGVTIVFGRTLNAKLTSYSNLRYSTLFNYIIGIIGSIIIVLLTKTTLPETLPDFKMSDIFIYLGGAIGVVMVMANSYLTTKLSSMVFTLLLFCAQLFTGIAIDYFISGDYSNGKVIGGLIILAGLWISNKKEITK